MPDTQSVVFTAAPETLQKAFADIDGALSAEGASGDQNVYVAACLPGGPYTRVTKPDGEEIDVPHVVLGVQGHGRSYTYLALPVEAVEAEGQFLLGPGDAALLKRWAAEAGGRVKLATFTHERVSGLPMLTVEHSKPRGRVPLDIQAIYEPYELAEIFPSLQDIFETPRIKLDERADEASAMLRVGDTVAGYAASGTERVGDMVFRPGQLELVVFNSPGASSVTTRQLAHFPGDLNLTWDLTPALVKSLARAFRQENCHVDYEPDADPQPLSQGAFRVAYEVTVRRGVKMYVQRQMNVQRQYASMKRWLDPGETDADLFSAPGCELWATVAMADFFGAVREIWALNEGVTLRLSRVTLPDTDDGDSGPHVMAQFGGESMYAGYAKGQFGRADTSHFFLHESVSKAVQTVMGQVSAFQIVSYPDPRAKHKGGAELENAMILVPVGPDDDPSKPPVDPPVYVSVVW